MASKEQPTAHSQIRVYYCPSCYEHATSAVLADAYERGRQDERQRANLAEAALQELRDTYAEFQTKHGITLEDGDPSKPGTLGHVLAERDRLREVLTAIQRDATRLAPFCDDGRHALEMIANTAGNALNAQHAEALVLWLTDTAVEDMRRGRLPGVGGIALQPSEDHTLRACLALEHGTANTHAPQCAEAAEARVRELEEERDRLREALQRDRFLLWEAKYLIRRGQAESRLQIAIPPQQWSERAAAWHSRFPFDDHPLKPTHDEKVPLADAFADTPEQGEQKAHPQDTCADCGTPLKVSPPSPVTGGAWHRYCPNEACPSKTPHGSCWCGAPLEQRFWRDEGADGFWCSANAEHRPCPNCLQWVEWRSVENDGSGIEGYQHKPSAFWLRCPGPNKEPA